MKTDRTHPRFEDNQVLSSGQLNELFDFLNDQHHELVACGVGAGVACGLEISNDEDSTLTISRGLAITSLGHHICVDSSQTVSFVAEFLDEAAYFGGAGQIWALFTADGPDRTPLADVPGGLDDKCVALYLEEREEDLDRCTAENCLHRGKRIHLHWHLLLVEKSGALPLIRKALILPAEAGELEMERLYHARYDIKPIHLQRALISPEQAQAFGAIRLEFQEACNSAIHGLADALASGFEAYRPLLEEAVGTDNPFAGLRRRLLARLSEVLRRSEGIGIQLFYDFLRDLIEAYGEFAVAAFEVRGECHHDPDLFPHHVFLGCAVATDECKPSLYRQEFIPASIQGRLSEKRRRAVLLFRRIVRLIDEHEMRSTTGNDEIRITPGGGLGGAVGRRAIPYYYDYEPVAESWSFDTAERCCENAQLGYFAGSHSESPRLREPLKYSLDDCEFLRIEGHLGRVSEDVTTTIDSVRQAYNLPFDLVTVKLGDLSDEDIAKICTFEDLLVLYLVTREELLCTLKESLTFLIQLGGRRKPEREKEEREEEEEEEEEPEDDVPEADAPTEYIDPGIIFTRGEDYLIDLSGVSIFDEQIAVENAPTHDPELPYRAMSHAHTTHLRAAEIAESSFDPVNRAAATGYARYTVEDDRHEFLEKVKSKGVAEDVAAAGYFMDDSYVFSKGNVHFRLAVVSDHIRRLLTPTQRLNALTQELIAGLIQLTQLMPEDLFVFDFESFEKRHVRMKRIVENLRTLLESLLATPRYKVIGFERTLISVLVCLLKNCTVTRLESIMREFRRREERSKESEIFANFVRQHPGIEHKSGVNKGGTFIIVTATPSELRGEEPPGGNRFRRFFSDAFARLPFSRKLDRDFELTSSDTAFFDLLNIPGLSKEDSVPVLHLLEKSAGKQLSASYPYRRLYLEFLDHVRERARTEEEQEIVVADFCLPYLCCGGCQQVSYIVVPDPSIRLEKFSFCKGDPGLYLVEVSPPGGVLTGAGIVTGDDVPEEAGLDPSASYFKPSHEEVADLESTTLTYRFGTKDVSVQLSLTDHPVAAFEHTLLGFDRHSIRMRFDNLSDAGSEFTWTFNGATEEATTLDPIEHEFRFDDDDEAREIRVKLEASHEDCRSEVEKVIKVRVVIVEPAEHDFGEVIIGTEAPTTDISVTNVGTDEVEIAGFPVTGDGAVSFSVVADGPVSLAPNHSTTVTVAFGPQDVTEAAVGSLSVDAELDEAAGVSLTGSAKRLLPGIEVTPFLIDFDGVRVGAPSSPGTLTIRNTGEADLIIESITPGPGAVDFEVGPVPGSVAPGASESIEVRWTPSNAGGMTSTIAISSNDEAAGVQTVSLRGTGVEPRLTVEPEILRFGEVEVDTESERETILVGNVGDADLVITELSLDPLEAPFFTETTTPLVIAPQAVAEVPFAFTPVRSESVAATLTIVSDDGTRPQVPIALTGTGTPVPVPHLDAPNRLDLGSVRVGTSSGTPLAITNDGTGTLLITRVTIENNDQFTVPELPAQGTSVAPGADLQIVVKVEPQASGPLDGVLVIESTDPENQEHRVALQAVGVEPILDVSPDEVSFGDVTVGTSSETRVVTVANLGSDDLRVSEITVPPASSGFSLSFQGPLPISTAPAAELAIDVTLLPRSEGATESSFDIVTDAADGTATIRLAGNGTPAPVARLDVPSELDFGNVRAGRDAPPLRIDLTNSGTADLEIESVTIAEAVGFETQDFTRILAPNESTPVTVTFASDTLGSAETELLIGSTAETPTVAVRLTATVVAPAAELSRELIDFGSRTVGDTGVESFTMRNRGTAELEVNAITSTSGPFSVLENPAPTSVAPDGSLVVNVSYTPVDGQSTGTITVATDDVNAPQLQVSLEGIGEVPAVPEVRLPGPVDFALTRVGEVSSRDVRIENIGNADLHVDDPDASEPFAVAPTSIVVPAGGTGALSVSFGPTQRGSQQGALTFSTNAQNEPSVVPLTGRGGLPEINVIPRLISFGTVVVGEVSEPRTLRIESNGDFPLDLRLNLPTGVFIVDDIEAPDGAGPAELAAGILLKQQQRVLISLRYRPDTPGQDGSDSQTFLVRSDDEVEPRIAIRLVGERVVRDQPGSLISVKPPALDFGTVIRGTSRELNLTLTNLSPGPIAGLEAGITQSDGEFTIVEAPAQLLPGDQATMVVRFSPQALAEFTATLRVTSADPPVGDIIVPLRGLGRRRAAIDRETVRVPIGTTLENTTVRIDGLTLGAPATTVEAERYVRLFRGTEAESSLRALHDELGAASSDNETVRRSVLGGARDIRLAEMSSLGFRATTETMLEVSGATDRRARRDDATYMWSLYEAHLSNLVQFLRMRRVDIEEGSAFAGTLDEIVDQVTRLQAEFGPGIVVASAELSDMLVDEGRFENKIVAREPIAALRDLLERP